MLDSANSVNFEREMKRCVQGKRNVAPSRPRPPKVKRIGAAGGREGEVYTSEPKESGRLYFETLETRNADRGNKNTAIMASWLFGNPE